MPIDDVVVAVADWKNRIRDVQLYTDYYAGRHRIGQFATPAFRRSFEWVLLNARENLCKAVVKGFASKMVIKGWEAKNAALSKQAGKLVDDLKLSKVFNLVHRESPRTGDAYVLVWPDAAGNNKAWPKLSSQMAVKTKPGDPDSLQWAAMLWITDEGFGRVNLYYEGVLERYTTKGKLRERSAAPGDPVDWPAKASSYELYSADGDPDVIGHDYGRVPVVWFPWDADELGCHGRSILEDVVPLQDGLNKSVADMIVGGESIAMPLRYLLNFVAKKKIDPITGEITEAKIVADPTVKKFLTVPGNGPIGQLEPPDATKLIAVHQEFAAKIQRVTGLPAFYVSQTAGEPPTGVALRVMATRLTDTSREAHTDFGPEWSSVMDLLGVTGVRPRWEDPAPMDESERLANAEVRKAIGFGFRENLLAMGYDEDDVTRIETDAAATAASAANIGDLAARGFQAGVDPAQLLG